MDTALKREFLEEVGIDLTAIGRIVYVGERFNQPLNRHTIMVFKEVFADIHEATARDGFDQVEWFSLEELNDPCFSYN